MITRFVIFLTVMFCSFTVSWGQAPTITSFTPLSGPAGTVVTINGTGFSSTPSSNIVFFGATQAAVSASTPLELTVTVPNGSTYKPISVMVAGLTALSQTPFNATFGAGVGDINACSFAPKVDFISGTRPTDLALADMDGDGKPEIASTLR